MNLMPAPDCSAQCLTSSSMLLNVIFSVFKSCIRAIVSTVVLMDSVVSITGRLNAVTGGFSKAGSVVALRSATSLRSDENACGVISGFLPVSILAAIFAVVGLSVMPDATAALAVSSMTTDVAASGVTAGVLGARISTLVSLLRISLGRPPATWKSGSSATSPVVIPTCCTS